MLHGYLPTILDGLRVTLSVGLVSLAVACVFGMIAALMKLSESRAARFAADAYTTIIRGVPDLLLILIIFYGGQIALNNVAEARGWGYIDVNPFIAGTLTLGFVFGSYLCETFRGAILAVPRGQMEAGAAYGMTPMQVIRRITVPQMIRHALPGFTNNWLVLVKATALVSIIGLDDMVHRAGLASAATREPFTFYFAIGLIYLTVTTVSILALKLVERRYSLGVRRAEL